MAAPAIVSATPGAPPWTSRIALIGMFSWPNRALVRVMIEVRNVRKTACFMMFLMEDGLQLEMNERVAPGNDGRPAAEKDLMRDSWEMTDLREQK